MMYDYADPLALIVEATFDRRSGVLSATDVDTGENVTVRNVVSGNGANYNDPNSEGIIGSGPLPAGDYLIGNGYDSGHGGDDWWYKLYGPDGNGGYSYTCIPVADPASKQTVCRNAFNLHVGRQSDGCVTVWSDVPRSDPRYPMSTSFNKLKRLLDNTKPLVYKNSKYRGKLKVK